MTPITGVGNADAPGLIGTRHANAVIATPVHHHVGRRRHVAGDARRTSAVGRVEMMRPGVVLRWGVTRRAQRIS